MPSIVFLRQHGYNIVSILEEYAGISDHDVINKAKKENLVILTFDKDYGEIIFKHGHTNPPAVVTFRFKGEHPQTAGELLKYFIENNDLKVENAFTVIVQEGLRQRKY